MLDQKDLIEFLTAQTVYVFDPDTLGPVASVTYAEQGKVFMTHHDGRPDGGDWGIEGTFYWTRYDAFRGGSVNTFYLERVDAKTVQAYYRDGTRAFLQSHKVSLLPSS